MKAFLLCRTDQDLKIKHDFNPGEIPDFFIPENFFYILNFSINLHVYTLNVYT